MGFTIRNVAAECKFCEAVTVEALSEVIAPQAVAAVVAAAEQRGPVRRRRKLTSEMTLWLVVALHLFARRSIPGVLRALVQGTRLVWSTPCLVVPGASALVYRRYQLGARPLAALFHCICRPLATPQTPGAFRFGLRLVGIDGTIEAVPESAANARVFGRRANACGPAAYPQVLAVYLVEIGTHAIFDAGFWAGPTSEHRAARRLVRALEPDRLLWWDRGFHSLALLHAVRARGAHVLGRLPAHVHPQLRRVLPDGSALVYLRPSRDEAGQARGGMEVRLVSYRLQGATNAGATNAGATNAGATNAGATNAGATNAGATGETYHLITTLLDHEQAPAAALATTYHERWEVEGMLDELATHQRLGTRTLRSRRPVGVIQELYGLLLAHYVVRAWMHQAAQQANLDPDRLSFTTALELVSAALLEFQLVLPAQRPALIQRLLADLAQARLPVRRPRSCPRARKRPPKRYRFKPVAQPNTPRAADTYAERVLLAPSTSRCLI